MCEQSGVTEPRLRNNQSGHYDYDRDGTDWISVATVSSFAVERH